MNVDWAPGEGDMNPVQLRRLKSLDHLHLCVHSMVLGFFGSLNTPMTSIHQINLRTSDVAELLRFEVLDLKRVTVIAYDSLEEFEDEWMPHRTTEEKYRFRFTLEQKRGIARLMEKTLLFEDEIKKVLAAKEREIFEMEEMVKIMEASLEIRHNVQRADLERNMA
ncbi:MAG: hypothetical protein Q9170_007011 [Blastenia crenularia]